MREDALIYLAGTSRGGTTVLQAALASFEDVAATGEVKRLRELTANQSQCGCGQPVAQCQVWSHMGALPPVPALTKTATMLAGLARSGGLPLRGSTARAAAALAENTKILAAALGNQVIVDSSKDLDRLALHAHNRALTLIPVHVVRDPRGVLHSGMRRTRFTPERIARNWFRLNAAAMALRRLTPQLPWRTVRYEDFCEDPLGTCRGILAATGRAHPLRSSPAVQHALGGSPGFQFAGAEAIKVQEPWRRELSPELQQMALRSGGFIARRFGYLE